MLTTTSSTAHSSVHAHTRSQRRSVVVQAAGSQTGSRVEQWLKTPFDIASFAPRTALGALLSLPERLQTLPTDVQRMTELVQDPRPVEEKQEVVLQEVEDTLVTFLERGATVETDILANLKTLLPAEVVQQLDELIPPPPSAAPQSMQQQQRRDTDVPEPPPVTYTADSVLENQIASEMTEIKAAVAGLKAALEAVRANADPARNSMLRLNLREARDILARRLQEVGPGTAPAGTSSDAALSAASREASVLLDEVDAHFFA